MSKRKNNPILDMYRKKQDNVDDPPVTIHRLHPLK